MFGCYFKRNHSDHVAEGRYFVRSMELIPKHDLFAGWTEVAENPIELIIF